MSRAQSDAIGFVLVFSLIVVTVGAVYAVGFGALQDVRAEEQLDNMERAFDVLDDNLADMAREGAPSRATEIKLNGGTLAVDGTATVTVYAENTSAASDNATVVATAVPITYSRDGSGVAASFGAVIRSDRGGSAMRTDPGWVVDDDRAMVPLVITSPSGERNALGGSSTVLVRGDVTGRGIVAELTAGADSDVRVNVTVESPRADAWGRYFEREGMTAVDADGGDGSVTYTFVVNRIVVQQTTVAVELER